MSTPRAFRDDYDPPERSTYYAPFTDEFDPTGEPDWIDPCEPYEEAS